MDLVADMLLSHLPAAHGHKVSVGGIRPAMRRRIGSLSPIARTQYALNADRLLGRFCDYPRLLRAIRDDYDIFHIVDHSYAHLVQHLPSERTVVTCHDLATFECLLEPKRAPRSRAFRAMTGRILSGLTKAAHVACVSAATRDQVLGYGLLPAERVSVVHNGVDPTCSPEPDTVADAEAARLLGPVDPEAMDLLHVGSSVERKRIDVLLQVFARTRQEFPEARLIRVGGPFTAPQMALVERLDLAGSIIVLPFLDRPVLAAVYRRASLVLQTSEMEGFGLPVAEALASGTLVVASNIPVLREVGGNAAVYCPVADVPIWSETVCNLICEQREQPIVWAERRLAALHHASRFSWKETARELVGLYLQLPSGHTRSPRVSSAHLQPAL